MPMQNPLHHKRILLGVTGGIAAYRSPELVRRLREQGAQVQVVMTRNACEFISPLTMQAVSGQPARIEMFDLQAEAGMSHIELARNHDLIAVAPASAGFVARLAHGLADDLLSTLCLAADCPIAVAPAMNRLMWSNAATQHNIALLAERAIALLGPAEGDQACGETGPGRMLSPDELSQSLAGLLLASGSLQGVKTVVTVGSTWEAIDPVRGITNESSGKMGFAVAAAAAAAGADVTVVCGRTAVNPPPRIGQLLRVTGAQEMCDAVFAQLGDCQLFVSVAAVADFRPAQAAPSKIKKSGAQTRQLELVRNPDILAQAKQKHPHVFTVGFAAETDNLLSEGKRKLLSKGADLIVANAVHADSCVFGSDTNTLHVIDRSGVTQMGPGLKTRLAVQLVDHISSRFHASGAIQNSR